MKRLTRLLTFAQPTPLEQAAAELEQARRDLLVHSARREYYMALERMLEHRVVRLQLAVTDLSAGEPRGGCDAAER